jgi:MFS family permease
VSIGVYVTDTTGQAFWAGLVAAATFVPTAFLGPVGGALADRYERKKLLLASTTGSTLFAAILCVLFIAGDPAPALVTLIVFFAGCSWAIGFPAYQTILPELVPRDELAGAMGLSSAQWNLGRVIGPAIAGVVLTNFGVAWALGINTLSFLAPLIVVAGLTLPRPERHDGSSLLHSMREGWRYATSEPGLRVILVGFCGALIFVAPFIALVPAVAVKVFDAPERGTSLLITAQGVGAVAMGIAIGGLGNRFGLRRVFTGCLALLVPAVVAYAYAPTLVWAAAGIAVVGFLYLGVISSVMTMAQLRSPDRLRGRVLSINNVALGLLYPLSATVQGRIADNVGLRATAGGAALTLGVGLLLARLLRHGATAVLDDPAGDVTTAG